jgi:hypothetical protein
MVSSVVIEKRGTPRNSLWFSLVDRRAATVRRCDAALAQDEHLGLAVEGARLDMATQPIGR